MNKIVINENKHLGQVNPMLHSQFIEFLGSCIYDGIWVGEDSEIPNYRGLRKDVVDGLKELQPPIIRWPGGCYADTYHWRDGIGPRDQRPTTYNETFGTHTIDDHQFGTHEFMSLCRLVGAEPWLNVNMMTGNTAEMREWIEYCNREEATTLAKERESNGSKEAFDVKYWGIGNEPWAGGGNYTASSYADAYRQYATSVPNFGEFMSTDKKMIRIACGPDGNKAKERVEWTRDLFESFQNYRAPAMDALDLHFYNWNLTDFNTKETSFDHEGWYKVIDTCLELDDVIKEQQQLIEKGLAGFEKPEDLINEEFYEKPSCKLIVGEWGNWHGSAFVARPALYQQCTMRDAITSALTLDIFHHNCNSVEMACVAQSVNVLNSLFLTDGSKFLKTPNYDVFKMYQVHRDGVAIESRYDGVQKSDEGRVFVFASAKGKEIYVNIVNTDYGQGKEVIIEFDGETSFETVRLLNSELTTDHNTFEEPNKVREKDGVAPEKDGANYKVVLPAASISVYKFIKTYEEK